MGGILFATPVQRHPSPESADRRPARRTEGRDRVLPASDREGGLRAEPAQPRARATESRRDARARESRRGAHDVSPRPRDVACARSRPSARAGAPQRPGLCGDLRRRSRSRRHRARRGEPGCAPPPDPPDACVCGVQPLDPLRAARRGRPRGACDRRRARAQRIGEAARPHRVVLDPRVLARAETKGPRRRRPRVCVRAQTIRRSPRRCAGDARRGVNARRWRSSERREALRRAREALPRAVRRGHRGHAPALAVRRLSQCQRAERRQGSGE